MSDLYIKKNGLLYSPDGKTVIGVDDTSTDFTGRVPYGAKFIDDEVFSQCPYENILLPDSVISLGPCLFKDSLALEYVKLPAFIKELPLGLFSGCVALNKVTMPNELDGFPQGLFKDCQSLSEIPFRAGIKVLPKSVFEGCTGLKSLVVPNTVESIEEKAVAGCSGLTGLVIPASVNYIADDAFDGCTSLHNIRIVGNNQTFFVGEDGCLYKRGDAEGDEELGAAELVIKICKVDPSSVGYFEENVEDKPIEPDEVDDEDVLEPDPVFASEIEATGEEMEMFGVVEEETSEVETDTTEVENETTEVENETTEAEAEPVVVDEPEPEMEPVVVDESVVGHDVEPEAEPETVVGQDAEPEPETVADVETDTEVGQAVEPENENIEIKKDDIVGDNMSDESNVDSMLADIMGEERERIAATDNVGISEKESEVLSEAMSVMEDSEIAKGPSVSTDELEKLFSKNEEQEIAAQNDEEKRNPNELDSKTKILVDSVSYSKILNFQPAEENQNDGDLFVIAEKLVKDESGNESFSTHLETCCSKMALIHDFRRVIMLFGLPLDNDEFMEFYRYFIGKKNIILACEADKPSGLSEYCKAVCENSRISLDKKELVEQRKYASIKTETLVKLVVKDKYQ